ncbi:MAG: hypothetical protein HYY51_01610 [Candidatus Magasanikbacteria bacterium]|nr:hypothetical protein [Candidatus Magasanikbacteria bacterium]
MHGTTKRRTRFALIGLIVLFLSVQVIGLGTFARPAYAGLPVSVIESIPEKTTNIMDTIGDALLAVALGTLVNATSYFTRKLAYDSAKWVASGGKGQGALAFEQGAGEYFKSVALDTAAGAIDQFGEGLFGVSLCRPPNLEAQVFIQVGLRSLYDDIDGKGGPRPRCQWNEFSESWKEFGNQLGDTPYDTISGAFANAVKVDQSDFGIALGLSAQVGRVAVDAKKGADTDRLEGQGFKPLSNLIQGKVKTPAQIIQEETKAVTAKHQGQLSAGQVAGIYGSGMLQVIPSALSVFLNTLVSSLLDQLLTEGLFPDATDVGDKGTDTSIADSVVSEFASVLNVNRKAAENSFNFLFTSVPIKEINIYPLLDQYSSCPENPGLNNCVIDAGLRQAVERANVGIPLTIEQALAQGLLHEDWPLISPRRTIDHEGINAVRACSSGKYCYANIQKLRKARIVPLGFEIAALKADPDAPQKWTLGAVVKGFYDCAPNGAPNSEFPFCHLIDPKWIIRLPEPRCEAKVFGPNLVTPEAPQRQQECVDISTCLQQDENGACLSNYGYCLREQNVWRVGGNSCPAQFSTCRTFINTKSNTVSSYLTRTLDAGECSQEAVGCRAYSMYQEGDAWTNSGAIDLALKKQGINQTIFFNRAVEQFNNCPPDSIGCSTFYIAGFDLNTDSYKKTTDQVHLKKAPEYLGCYDINLLSKGVVNWPVNELDLEKLSERPEACNQYAQVCLPEEEGCIEYQPKTEGSNFVAVVGGNSCKEECLGYDTFRQEEAPFEASVFPLYFIPSQATACSATYNGCSEFTNIDTALSGGEGLEYYKDIKYCQKPSGANERTYYSWEGSASEGFVLRVHRMLQIDQKESQYISALNLALNVGDSSASVFGPGAPAFANDSEASLQNAYDFCNEINYTVLINNPYDLEAANSNCRALYDEEGHIYYRMLNDTVSVSEDCHPLRITEASLEEDDNLKGNEALCLDKKGMWTGSGATGICKRCFNGGEYKDGSCVYWSITSEAESCPAEFNGCRAFNGNFGNNIRTVEYFSFEPEADSEDALNQAAAGWFGAQEDGPIAVKPDATQVGLYSLQVNDSMLAYAFEPDVIQSEKWYELEFWAHGTPQNLSIQITQLLGGDTEAGDIIKADFTADPSVPGKQIKVPVGEAWQSYRLGPVRFSGDGSKKSHLIFERSFVGASGPYFIDSLRIIEVESQDHYVKNSWKQRIDLNGETVTADVPLSCDDKPDDGLPGSALGCREYTDVEFSEPVYATGFDKLCRPQAAGCMALYDTYNTVDMEDEEQARVHNAWCASDAEGTCTLSKNGQDLGSCEILKGQKGCYISSPVIVPTLADLESSWIKESSVVVPQDTPEESPIFLTYRNEFVCQSQFRGCQATGLEDHLVPDEKSGSYAFNATLVKNDPAHYEQTLCRSDLLGCSEYKSGNDLLYFKDPALTAHKICSYKEQQDINGQVKFGWFKDGVGRCSNNLEQLCSENVQCGEEENAECVDKGKIECYGNFVKAGGEYGIWSNDSEKYDGFVGLCSENHHLCTELIDPADSSELKPEGSSYYVIVDQQLLSKAGDCEGKVSLKEGCVLFNRTDQPNKLYDSAKTYELSEKAKPQYALVAPVSEGQDKDANLILKVDRDRICSEWLACKNKSVISNSDGTQKSVCYNFDACRSTVKGVECVDWVGTGDFDLTPLGESVYVKRDTSWFGEDYSGYSLFNKHQIYDLKQLVVEDEPVSYLVYELPSLITDNIDPALGCGPLSGKEDWDSCGFGSTKGGRCYNNTCIFPVEGAWPADLDLNAVEANGGTSLITRYLTGGSCKAPPEQNSPYSFSIATQVEEFSVEGQTRKEFTTKRAGFEGANICQDGDCSCSYKKTEYNGLPIPDFWPSSKDSYIQGICVGGDKEKKPCAVEKDCNTYDVDENLVSGGSCARVENIETHTGLYGFCLERDLSRPIDKTKGEFACLTWLPVDVSATQVDLYNNDPLAGYYPLVDAVSKSNNDKTIIGGQVYCTDSDAHGLGQYKKDLFIALPGNNQSSEYEKYRSWGYSFEPNSNDDPDVPSVFSVTPNLSWLHHFPAASQQGNFGAVTSAAEYQKYLYTYMSSHNWFSFREPNSHVWFVNNPKEWITYHNEPSVYETYINNAWNDAGSVGLPNWKPTLGYEKLVDLGETSVIEMNELLPREDMIRKIRFGPLVVHAFRIWANSVGGGNDYVPDDRRLYITDRAELDFDALNRGSALEFEGPNGVIRYTKKVLDSRWGQEFQFGFKSKMPDGGNLYGLFIPLEDLEGKNGDVQNTKTFIEWVKGFIANGKGYKQNDFVPIHDDVPAYMLFYVRFTLEGNVYNKYDVDQNLKLEFQNPNSVIQTDFRYYKSKEFIKYWRLLQGGDQLLAASVEYYPRCTEFQQVYDSGIAEQDPSESTSKAWTNRVWQGAGYYLGPIFKDINAFISKFFGNITLDSFVRPYGSTYVDENQFKLPDEQVDNLFAVYNFDRIDLFSGIPYACKSPVYKEPYWTAASENKPEYEFGTIAPSTANYPGGIGCGAFKGTSYEMFAASDPTQKILVTPAENTLAGTDLLRQLFARTYKVRDSWLLHEISPMFEGPDYSYVVDKTGLAPKVYSLNPFRCFFKGSNIKTPDCVAAGANNITVNEQNGVVSDYDGDGKLEELVPGTNDPMPVVGVSSLEAKLRFFAWADDNRMPIKRVMIDWSDSTGILNEHMYGRYKNRKPFCAEAEAASDPTVGLCFGAPLTTGGYIFSGLTCLADNDCMLLDEFQCATPEERKNIDFKTPDNLVNYELKSPLFGNQPRACQEGYFEFVHGYGCSELDVTLAGKDGFDYVVSYGSLTEGEQVTLKSMGYTAADTPYVCKFKPKVQVLDNWGWCNGTCQVMPGGVLPNSEMGCYTKYNGQIISGAKVYGVLYDQCNGKAFDAIEPSDVKKQKLEKTKEDYDKAWTQYKGSIIVVPYKK